MNSLKSLAILCCKIFLHIIFPVDEPFKKDTRKNFHDEKISDEPEKISLPENLDDEYISVLFEKEPITRQLETLKVYSAAEYYSGIRSIIHEFKYNDKKILCSYLGRAMGKFFTPPEINYIIPVPLHIDSTRKYNQSYEIAKSIGEIWNVKVLEAAKWSRIIPRHTKQSAKERRQISSDDFTITKDIRGRKAIIIDDVCTTGATLENFAKALEESGVWVVCAYTLAMVGE